MVDLTISTSTTYNEDLFVAIQNVSMASVEYCLLLAAI